jgi:hypothetical protein
MSQWSVPVEQSKTGWSVDCLGINAQVIPPVLDQWVTSDLRSDGMTKSQIGRAPAWESAFTGHEQQAVTVP